jgi:hypothetical protein
MSDPSSINLPIGQALTSDMLYGLKPSAPKSRFYRINVSPLNKSTFVALDQVIIELPTGRKNTWLDQSQSYLKFSVQCTSNVAATEGGSGIYLENTAYSFIQRLDIYNSSNLIETINEYGQLANALLDSTLTRSDKAGLSPMIGCNPYNSILPGAPPAVMAYKGVAYSQLAGDRSGLSIASTTPANSATAIPYTFCLPLLSGVVGVNASKMLPIGQLSAPIRMEFYLSSNDDAIYYGVAGLGAIWQLVNVEFCACYVEIQDDNIVPQSDPNTPEYISTKTYRQTSTYLPAATSGEFTVMVPFRCASLTALYARFRNQSTAVQGVNLTAAYRKSCSINPNISNWYFRIGSSIYPNKPVYLINGSLVGSGAEGYAELLKSFHSLASVTGNTSIMNNQYNVCAGVPNVGNTASLPIQGWSIPYPPGIKQNGAQDTHNNAFMIGLECESFSNRSDTILSGISTLNSQVFFTASIQNGATMGGGGPTPFNYTLDMFAQMDMILVIQNGLLTAKF